MTFRPQYQRTVDTGPPRTNTGLTGLGAVGGPRGVGAGALRVLVEFLTSYDAGALEELESRLADLDKFENQTAGKRERAIRQEAAARATITRIQKLQNSLTSDQAKQLQKIIDLEKRRQQALQIAGNRAVDSQGRPVVDQATRSAAAKEAQDLGREIAVNAQILSKATGLAKRDVTLLLNAERNIEAAKRRQVAAANSVRNADRQSVAAGKERLAVETQIASVRGRLGAAVGKLGSLALGAVGGLVGGAIVGLGFTAVQAGIEALGGVIQDIIDPANKAREAISDLGSEVQSLAEKGDQDFFDAMRQKLRDLGPLARGLNADILGQAAALGVVNDALEEYNRLIDIQKNIDNLREEAIRKRVQQLREESTILRGNVGGISPLPFNIGGTNLADARAEEQRILAQAIREVDAAARGAASGVNAAALAERALANAAAYASIQQDNLASSITRARNAALSAARSNFNNLPPTSGAREASRIQAQMDFQAEAAAQRAYNESLAANATERSNLLLQQQLQLTNQVVNVQQYAGEQRLMAIQHNISALQNATSAEEQQLDALNGQISAVQRLYRAQERQEQAHLRALDKQIKALRKADEAADKADSARLEVIDEQIRALQEQGDAQDRVNKLLDLQYRASQTLRRNEGESIGDFLNRRAQENREVLAGFASLRRDSQIANLQKEKEALSDAIEAENERREAIIERAEAQREAFQEQVEQAQEQRQMHLEALQAQQEQLQAVAERRQKERQMAIQALQEEAERVQTEIALRENAERRKEIMEQEAERKRQKRLQEALRRAQERDRLETESRKQALDKQEAAINASYDRVERIMNDSFLTQLSSAIGFANTFEQLQSLGGTIAGARLALAQLKAMVESGLIAPALAAPFISRAESIIARYYAQKARLMPTIPTNRQPIPYQHGGVLELTNARNPFGSNVRFGESGPELGVILSNKVTEALRQSSKSDLPPQTFIINRSDDPWRDKQRFSRTVRDAMSEALR